MSGFKKMNILNAVYGDSTGGRWVATLKTASLLAEAGHQLTLLIDPEDVAKIPADFPATIRVETLHNSGHYDLVASWRARSMLKQLKIDLCICHSGRAIYLLKRAACGLCPVVAFNHSHNIKRTLKADAFFCITPFMKQLIDQHTGGSKPSVVISNAVTIPDPDMLHAPDNAIFTLGAIARMAPNKGLHHLIKALGILHQQGMAFHACIAGDGEERQNLERMAVSLGIANHVEFIGWINAQTKTDFYNRVDAMCFTSEWDVQPLVILESFAYAKPLIGTDIDGPSSMYEHGKTALVVPPENPEALANAIRSLAESAELRRELSRNGREKAIREHSDEVIKRLLAEHSRTLVEHFQGSTP